MPHVDFSDGGRQCCFRDDACDFIVAEVYLFNRGEVEQLSREVYDLVVAEVDFLDALAVLEGSGQGLEFVVLEYYGAEVG